MPMKKNSLKRILASLGSGNSINHEDRHCLESYLDDKILIPDETWAAHSDKKTVVVKSSDDRWVHDENTKFTYPIKDGVVGLQNDGAVRILFLNNMKIDIKENGIHKCLLQIAIPSLVFKKHGLYRNLRAMDETAKLIKKQCPDLIVEGECFLRSHGEKMRLMVDFDRYEKAVLIDPVQ